MQHLPSYVPSRMRKETKRTIRPLSWGLVARAAQTTTRSARCTRTWIRTIDTLCDDYSLVIIFSFTGSIPRGTPICDQTRAWPSNDMHSRYEQKRHSTASPSSIPCLQCIDHLQVHLRMMFDGSHNCACCNCPHVHIVMAYPHS